MNRPVIVSQKLAFVGGVGLLALTLGAPSANAQSQFCPNNTGFGGGTCISGGQGAVSTAALSSQALSSATQSVTETSTEKTVAAVQRRLEQERPQQAAAPAARTAPQRRAVATRRDLKDPGIMVTKAPPVVSYGPTFAMWAHAFGDWEKWTDDTFGIRTLGSNPTWITTKRETTTFGVVGGADWTLNSATSTWVFGVLAGYTDSRIKFSGNSVGAAADNSTVSSVTGDVRGPNVGAYVTFATGPWSFDVTGRADFLDIDQSFSEILFANANPVSNSGAASTDVVNISISANANYRIPTSATTWWEPTVGFRYTHSNYGSNAFVLGMDDGEIWRLQGGARFGAQYYWGATLVNATFTALVYSDVSISGLVIAGGSFEGGSAVPSEEGEVRGMGILALNFIHSPTYTTFINAEVRGGDEYFGAGGKIGVRVNLN
jgi:outer membrane autotransporter protein